MDVDVQQAQEDPLEEDLPTCEYHLNVVVFYMFIRVPDASIEAPPSVLPQRRYCDITGLEV